MPLFIKTDEADYLNLDGCQRLCILPNSTEKDTSGAQIVVVYVNQRVEVVHTGPLVDCQQKMDVLGKKLNVVTVTATTSS